MRPPHNRDFHSGDFFTARYATASRIIRKIKDSWGTATSSDSVLDGYAKVDLLVLDEIGTIASGESDRGLLYEIVDPRWQRVLPMIAISNLNLAELTDVLSERGVDRLNDHGGLLCIFDWESFRR